MCNQMGHVDYFDVAARLAAVSKFPNELKTDTQPKFGPSQHLYLLGHQVSCAFSMKAYSLAD